MSKFLKIISALVLVAFAGAGVGCGPGESTTFGAETDDSGYREGQQLVKQGRPQEALVAYLKVIARRGEVAPESHLEAGLIYKQHLKDPVAAIYHFRKYLEQQPNSRQAPLVRQQIDAAKRDFLRSMPNQPSDSREVRIDAVDQRDRLERENEQLKTELTVLRGGGAVGAAQTLPRASTGSLDAPREARIAPAEDGAFVLTPAPLQQQPAAEPAPSTVQPAPVTAQSGVRAKPTAPSNTGGRRHTVSAKDTLFGIAKKYYNTATNARVQAIIQANRDVLPPDNTLKPGMELKIP